MSTRRLMMADSSHVIDGVIQDSWEEIVEICNAGNAQKYYSVGDTKELDLGEYGVVHMELGGFYCLLQTNECSAAPTIWISKEVSSKFTTDNLISVIPFVHHMLVVENYYSYADEDVKGRTYWSMGDTTDGVFYPSRRVMENRITLYRAAAKRVKTDIDTSEVVEYRLGGRPTNGAYAMCWVSESGACYNWTTGKYNDTKNCPYAFAFCL